MTPNITISVPQPYNKIGDGPEGPEVRIMTDQLSQRITGSTIIRVDTDWAKLRNDNWEAGISLFPAKIMEVTCKAKFMYWRLYSLGTHKYFYLTCTVLMSGKWLFKPGEYTKAIFILRTPLSTPIVFDRSEYSILDTPLFFDSQRGLSKLIFKFSDDELAKKMKEYGPDLLQVRVSFDEYRNKINSIRSDTMGVCKFLLTQKYFSGIGNYLKSEILYHSKIHPRRTIKSLTDDEIKRMLEWSLYLIRDSYHTGGATLSSYQSPLGEVGNFKRYVYKQDDDRISYAEIDGRGTYWREDLQF